MKEHSAVQREVRERYARAARQSGSAEQCCSSAEGDQSFLGPSLGCGRPLGRANLKSGEDVLDIGSGAGREVIEAARAVAPAGVAYGLDMTEEMLAIAMQNRRQAEAWNAVFIRGTMEDIPLPSQSVDVIISNCVINLSPDKPRVLRELMRVLRPGGRLAISDTIVAGVVPEAMRQDSALWCECVSGAMGIEECRLGLEQAGFSNILVDVEEWYDRFTTQEHGFRLGSAFISAVRPAIDPEARSCCANRSECNDLNLERAESGDLPQVLRLLSESGLPTEGVEQHFHTFVVSRDDNGNVIGTGGVEIHGQQALLRSVCVSPLHRGKNLGTLITEAAIEIASQHGCTEAYLLTTTAERFFRRKGFRTVERSHVSGPVLGSIEFRSVCPASATCMVRSLTRCC